MADDDEAEILRSIERLRRAGLVTANDYDPATGSGSVSFHPALHRLLLAGRRPQEDPAFLRLILAGDFEGARRWVEREAARLDETEGSSADARPGEAAPDA